MSDDDYINGFLTGGIVVLIIFTVSIFCFIGPKTTKAYQQQAIDHNAASWVVDQKTGQTTFKWKDEIK